MLKFNTEQAASYPSEPARPETSLLDVAAVASLLRRQWPLIVGIMVLALCAAVAYVSTARPRYTASANVLLDLRKNQVMQAQQVVGDQPTDASGIESQVEVLKSEGVALSVIRRLKLVDDADFAGSPGLVGRLMGLFSDDSGPSPTVEARERDALGAFANGLTVRRVGLTFVIQISFTSLNPDLSARVANAIADAYMDGELEARYDATRRASRWLQDRIGELQRETMVAERAVQTYRAENNIVDTGKGLISQQQLTDVNTQLITSRAATAEAKARLDRITEIGRSDVPDATVTDALRSDVISKLRSQYLDMSQQEAQFSARYGVNHNAAVNLRTQMRETRRAMDDELRRIAQTFRSDYEIARTREQSLQASLAQLVGESAVTGQASIRLRELESSAQSSRALYDSFVQRLGEANQQQTLPISEARLITAASPPRSKSAPRTNVILAGSVVFGLLLGVGAAFVRERLDNVFRTPGQVEAITRAECLGVLPNLPAPPKTSGPSAPADPALLKPDLGLYQHVLDAPFSRFAETLRSVKVAADISGLTHDTRVIGIVSAVPNEGKTTVASNIATLVANTGSRVLLIDGDLRNPSSTRALAPHATEGMIEVLSGGRPLAEAVKRDPKSGLHFLPAVVKGRISHTADLISSTAMANMLSAARETYDYVFVDLPPVVPIVDVRAASHLFDKFVFVVEWGRTSHDVVLEALSTDLMRERLLGVILNKANAAVMSRLESYKGRYYYNYYTEERGSGASGDTKVREAA